MRPQPDDFIIDLSCAEEIQADEEHTLSPLHRIAVLFWGSVFCWAVIFGVWSAVA